MKFKIKSIKYTETFLLVFIWLVVFLSPVFVPNSSETLNWKHITYVWVRFSPYLALSFVNHFVLVPILFYRSKKWYFGSVLVLIVLLIGIYESIQKPIPDFRNQQNQPRLEREFARPDMPPPYFNESKLKQRAHQKPNFPPHQRPAELPNWINTLLIGILVLGFDTGLRVTFKWTQTEHEREKLEKEKVKSELAFLRNQLSPHFFMNTLNNIHSLIDINTEEAKEAIIRLSKLMRHLLYDSDEELIPLTKEVQFIQSYVDLMKLRFTEKVKVSLTVVGELANIQIPPLLFTSLIENAFKYGISYKHESFVHIRLEKNNSELQFSVHNSKFRSNDSDQEHSGGIGLENTRKRLALLYGANHNFVINETNETYSVHLTLPV